MAEPKELNANDLDGVVGGSSSEPWTHMTIVPDRCVCCWSCVDECPTDAIRQVGDYMYIDPDLCIACGCCQNTCPVDAIV